MRSSSFPKHLFSLLLGTSMAATALAGPGPGHPAKSQPHTFTLGSNQFLLDGKPLQMISGEMHYPRIPREAWRARLKMAKAMGLNTIGTYVFWNVHEPQQGKYDFTGNNDVAAFVKMAQKKTCGWCCDLALTCAPNGNLAATPTGCRTCPA